MASTLEEAGYYLIVDTSSFSSDANNDSYHAYNSFLLKVTQANYARSNYAVRL